VVAWSNVYDEPIINIIDGVGGPLARGDIW